MAFGIFVTLYLVVLAVVAVFLPQLYSAGEAMRWMNPTQGMLLSWSPGLWVVGFILWCKCFSALVAKKKLEKRMAAQAAAQSAAKSAPLQTLQQQSAAAVASPAVVQPVVAPAAKSKKGSARAKSGAVAVGAFIVDNLSPTKRAASYAARNHELALSKFELEKLKQSQVCTLKGKSGPLCLCVTSQGKFVVVDAKYTRILAKLLAKTKEVAELEAMGY